MRERSERMTSAGHYKRKAGNKMTEKQEKLLKELENLLIKLNQECLDSEEFNFLIAGKRIFLRSIDEIVMNL